MSEIELKPCPFCGGNADVTSLGVTEFIIEPDGVVAGKIICEKCFASVIGYAEKATLFGEEDGRRTLHPITLSMVAIETKIAWNRRAE